MNYPTMAELVRYATELARIERIDYFDPRYPRQDEIRAWQTDCRRRSAARRKVFTDWCGRVRNGAAPLVPGQYGCQGRLEITAGAIDYTVGQYAPLEIWDAVYDYLVRTN